MVYITAITPKTAGTHEAIAGVRWLDAGDSTSNTMNKAQAVSWLQEGNRLFVASDTGPVEVHVVNGNLPYLRTVADGRYTDNLLALPRY